VAKSMELRPGSLGKVEALTLMNKFVILSLAWCYMVFGVNCSQTSAVRHSGGCSVMNSNLTKIARFSALPLVISC
jgi:hypothetical protein